MFALETPEIAFLLMAVRLASQLVKQVQAELVLTSQTKEDLSPVTVADYACQALVSHLLQGAFPNDPLVAEEDASGLRTPGEGEDLLRQVVRYVGDFVSTANAEKVLAWIDRGSASPSQRFWTLDPIDGTKGFLRGDQYAVAMALLIEGQVQVGALGCPNLRDASHPDADGPGSLLIAVRDQGAWHSDLDDSQEYRPLRVSGRTDPSRARLLRSFESGHTNVDKIVEFAAAMGVQVEARRMDSQAKYALLASGEADLMLRLLSPSKPHYREKIWDQAAGSLILEEAGGQISDLDGKPLDFTAGRTLANNRGVLASNRRLHAAALQSLHTIHA